MNQIRQFMGQSKAAIDAGDLERARTLAWKAQAALRGIGQAGKVSAVSTSGRKGHRGFLIVLCVLCG